jgi:hypothetical protein
MCDAWKFSLSDMETCEMPDLGSGNKTREYRRANSDASM